MIRTRTGHASMAQLTDDPAKRVFHLDTECYLVYLGSHSDDYRPFLRIGNTDSFPDSAKPVVYNVIITDSLTGSPLLERATLHSVGAGDIRYIGDPELVRRFKSFLRRNEVPMQGFTSYHGAMSDSSGAVVYFIDDGNVVIRHEKREIFNLKEREKTDGHFVYTARRVKNQLTKNVLRIPNRALDPAGVFVCDGTVYFFCRGRIGVINPPTDYFLSLAHAGIDPDLVSHVIVDELTEGAVRLFKRARTRGRRLVVNTPDKEVVRSLANLFVGSEGDLTVEYEQTPSSGSFPFMDFTLSRSGEDITVSHPEFPDSLLVSNQTRARTDAFMQLSSSAGTLTRRTGRETTVEKVFDGFPYRITQKTPTVDEFVATYVDGVVRSAREAMGEKRRQFMSLLNDCVADALARKDISRSLKTVKTRAKEVEADGFFTLSLVLKNIDSLITLIETGMPAGQHARGNLQQIRDVFPASVYHPNLVTAGIPLIGDLFLTEKATVPAYSLPSNVTASALEALSASSEAITRDSEVKTAHFEAETRRLHELISTLTTPALTEATASGRMKTLTEAAAERAAADRAAAESSAADPKKQSSRATNSTSATTREKTSSTEKKAPTDSSATVIGASPAVAGGSAKGTRGRGSRRREDNRSGLLVALLFILALMVGLGVYLLFIRPRTDDRPILTRPADTPTRPDDDAAVIPDDPSLDEPPDPDLPVDSDAPVAVDPPAVTPEPETPAPDTPVDPDAPLAVEPSAPDPDPAVADALDVEPEPDQPPAAPPTPEPTPQPPAQPVRPTAAEPIAPVSVGRFVVTPSDTMATVNTIASMNGYRILPDTRDFFPDPRVVYPAEVLTLPDGTRYTVTRGDNMWRIAERHVRDTLVRDAAELDRIVETIPEATTPDERRRLIQELESLRDRSLSENFVEEVRGIIRDLQ